MKNYFLPNKPPAEDGLYVCEFLVPAENPKIVFIENDFGKLFENESPQNEPPQNKLPQNGPPQNELLQKKPLENKPPPEDKLFVNEYCTSTETESSEILPVIEFLGPIKNEYSEIIHFGYNFEEPLKNAPPQNNPPENLPVQNNPPQNDPVQNDPAQNEPPQNAPPQNDPSQNGLHQNASPQNDPPQNGLHQNAPPQNDPPDEIYRCHICGTEYPLLYLYEFCLRSHYFIERHERRREQGNGEVSD